MPRRRASEGAQESEGGGAQSGAGGTPPLERFTPRARRVLAGALDEARRLKHRSIGPEHFILAMVQDETATGTVAFRRLGVDISSLVAEIERAFPAAEDALEVEPTLGEASQRVLSKALRSVNRTNDPVGTRELLLAVFRDGSLAPVLSELGLDPWRRMESRITGRIRPGEPLPAGPRENVITLRVGHRDAMAVDTLVDAGVMRTRSEAAAWLLHEGIAANEPLFEKVRGVMEEIRALREQAQRLAQEHKFQPDLEPGTGGA